jgi:hypothetical protein
MTCNPATIAWCGGIWLDNIRVSGVSVKKGGLLGDNVAITSSSNNVIAMGSLKALSSHIDPLVVVYDRTPQTTKELMQLYTASWLARIQIAAYQKV